MTCGECGNVTAPGAGFPNHVYCKRFLLHMEKREDASRCRDFIPKPITRYDRIRAKSVEEMAEWIMSIEPAACPFRDDHGDDCRFSHCKDCWLDWLKQEARE